MDILEAKSKQFMSNREQFAKDKLIKLLQDDGRGHKFPEFADRLKAFDLHIIYNDMNYTASISWEEGIIRINNGFLQPDPDGKMTVFNQLSVLIRHELSHNLMMHEVRMRNELAKKYGQEAADDISTSSTWADMENWLMDFEISNKVYDGGKDFDVKYAGKKLNETDKYIVYNMKLYGKVIRGLITEKLRPGWEHMSLEEMLDALEADIKKFESELQKNLAKKADREKYGITYSDNGLDNKIADLYYYAGNSLEHHYMGSIDDFMQNKAYFYFFPQGNVVATLDVLPDQWQKAIKDAYAYFSNKSLKVDDVQDLLGTIALSSPIAPLKLTAKDGKVICSLYNPEEKLFVSDMLRYYLTEDYYLPDYDKWYKKVSEVFGTNEFSKDDLAKVLASIK